MLKKRSSALLNRKIHNWGSIIVAIPLAVVLVTGVLLLLKKDIGWIQPPTVKGEQKGISIGFNRILTIARTVPEAGIGDWADVDRLDVRPGKGMVKVRARNRWEIQIDTNSGSILQVAYRRSDLIESIHDGSFFGNGVKLWVFLPSALVLIGLWITGMVLFIHPRLVKARKRRRAVARYAAHFSGVGLVASIVACSVAADSLASLPVKFDVEANYSIVRPDSFGSEWLFKINDTPAIKNPFDRAQGN